MGARVGRGGLSGAAAGGGGADGGGVGWGGGVLPAASTGWRVGGGVLLRELSCTPPSATFPACVLHSLVCLPPARWLRGLVMAAPFPFLRP